MNHKRRRPKHQRSGCLWCKPHKDERAPKEPRQPVVSDEQLLDEVDEEQDHGLADFLMMGLEEDREDRYERELFELITGEYGPIPYRPREAPPMRRHKDRRHFCGGKSGLEHVPVWERRRHWSMWRLVLRCERCGKLLGHERKLPKVA